MTSRFAAAALGALTVGTIGAMTAGMTSAGAAPARHRSASKASPAGVPTHQLQVRSHVNIRGASRDLSAEVRHLTRMQAAIAGSDAISASDTSAVSTALAADIAAVTADLAALPGATSQREVNTIVLSAHRSGELAAEQVLVALQAGHVTKRIATLTVAQAALTDQVNAAVEAGSDMTVANGQLADETAQLAAATDYASTALSAELAVDPSASAASLRTAFRGALVGLGNAAIAVRAANHDAAAVSAAVAASSTP